MLAGITVLIKMLSYLLLVILLALRRITLLWQYLNESMKKRSLKKAINSHFIIHFNFG